MNKLYFRETDRKTFTEADRDRDRQRETERDRERETDRDTQRQRVSIEKKTTFDRSFCQRLT